MPRRIFAAGSVTNATGAPLRLEFYPTSTSIRREADLWTIDGSNNLVERITNGVIVTTASGGYSAFAGPDDIDVLYALPNNTSSRTTLTATGTVAGGTTVDSNTYGQVWTSPTASTTLTGTLAAWVITAVDCTAGAGARTLPAASSVAIGTAVCAKKADTSANNLVVSRAGSDLIYGTGSGATSKTLSLAGEAVEFVSNGVDKWTVRSSDTPSSVLASTYLTQASATSTYSGKELGYAESATGVATTSNAGTLVTGTAVTVTIGTRPIRVMWGGLCESTTAAANGYLEMWEAGVRTGRVGFNTPGTGKFQQTTGSRRRAPAAGSVTYDVRLVSADNTSTVTAICGATFPCWISITEV